MIGRRHSQEMAGEGLRSDFQEKVDGQPQAGGVFCSRGVDKVKNASQTLTRRTEI